MRYLKIPVLIVITAVLLLAVPSVSNAARDLERILDYQSDITVNPDSTLTVTETIEVYANGESIRHGIYRDFPTIYTKPDGGQYITSFDVVEVSRDGKPEGSSLRGMQNGRRLYIGRSDVTIERGTYTYKITYKTDRQLGFFEGHDELYWNVTGNGWIFPIEKVSAIVKLPGRARARELVAYTGVKGAKGNDYIARVDQDGSAQFATTSRLRPGEGLTISVSWAKGFVREPQGYTAAGYFIRDHKHAFVSYGSFLVILLYYLVVWYKVGRDPKKGFIMAYYDPPDNLSPAAMSYIREFRLDNRAFTAAIVNLAVKGFLMIRQTNYRWYALEKTQKQPNQADSLSDGERSVLESLFTSNTKINLGEYNNKVESARKMLENKLKSQYFKKYFVTNTRYIKPGVVLSAVVPLMWGAFFYIDYLVAALVLNVVFYFLLKAPTAVGRKVIDRIEGFRMFLKATEEDRLNMLNPPERTPELFEAYLPYAIALGCENHWADQFTDTVSAASMAQSADRWYSSYSSDQGGFPRSFSKSLSSHLGGAISSSSTPPGSSSGGGGGGGGGGSSGGGGGGGGGGGW